MISTRGLIRFSRRPGSDLLSVIGRDTAGRVRDPFGNLWWIQTRLENLDEAEMTRRAQLPEYVEAMNYVQGAKL
ncbi:hypothetical protein [Amycolatopsis balhimycina]|uniref:hypothetical protein n=1 Tax=Amycolatopsis balhimycina TaxID=208443 RepID=UPI001B7FB6BF|nr:hypothetical protein [Amycolatopsis balhimycina]